MSAASNLGSFPPPTVRRRRPRETTVDDTESDGSISPRRRAAPTLYDILHYVVWNGYGLEVGKAIGASKVLDTAEMYESKFGLAQIVYRVRWNDEILLRTRLMFAAKKGNMARTRLLLANRADVHVADDMALQLAISNAHADVARLLIEHGADVRIAFSGKPRDYGVDRVAHRALIHELIKAHPTVCPGDVLVIAVMNADVALVSQTVDAGFAAWGGDEDKITDALYMGLFNDYIEQETDPEVVATARALFAHPHFSFHDRVVMAGHVARNNEEGIAWVRDLSVSPDAAANIDDLLWAACCAGLVDIVNSCLFRGGDPNIDAMGEEPSSNCAIMMAARDDKKDIVMILAQHDAINVDWALLAVSCICSVELATNLINRGADPMVYVGNTDESALRFSIEKGHVKLFRLLLKHCDHDEVQLTHLDLWQSVLRNAPPENAKVFADLLLKKKFWPKSHNLCYAAECGNLFMVRKILAAKVEGANALSVTPRNGMYSYESCTPLLSACFRDVRFGSLGGDFQVDRFKIVQLLCEAGANLEARINPTSLRVRLSPWCSGFTPLLLAARAGSAAVVNELLKRGAAINGRCANGQTALYYARDEGHDIIAQALLDRGATL